MSLYPRISICMFKIQRLHEFMPEGAFFMKELPIPIDASPIKNGHDFMVIRI